METEKIITPLNGYLALVLLLLTTVFMGYAFYSDHSVLVIVLAPLFMVLIKGLVVISPNNSKVLLLFGEYKGSIKLNGLFWINPFCERTSLSLRARNFESEKIKHI
jgi:hypothetical protein